MFVVRCSLFVGRCLLFVVCRLLFVARSPLFVVCVFAACCVWPFAVNCLMWFA